MKMIVRKTALAVCTFVLALILSTAASAACTGFDDVPESADCYTLTYHKAGFYRWRKACQNYHNFFNHVRKSPPSAFYS